MQISLKAIAGEISSAKIGDPMHRYWFLGPLATPNILQDLDYQVKEVN